MRLLLFPCLFSLVTLLGCSSAPTPDGPDASPAPAFEFDPAYFARVEGEVQAARR